MAQLCACDRPYVSVLATVYSNRVARGSASAHVPGTPRILAPPPYRLHPFGHGNAVGSVRWQLQFELQLRPQTQMHTYTHTRAFDSVVSQSSTERAASAQWVLIYEMVFIELINCTHIHTHSRKTARVSLERQIATLIECIIDVLYRYGA